MHGQGELIADPHHHVAEGQGPAVGGGDAHAHDVLIPQAHGRRVGGGHVDVPFGGDDALGQRDLAFGAHQLAGGGAGHVAGFPDGGADADGPGVGEGQLDLGGGADRAQNGHAREGFLGADNVHPLLAGELSGLRQILFMGQGVALAEQGFQVFLGDVHVAGGGFHQNEVLHGNLTHPILEKFCKHTGLLFIVPPTPCFFKGKLHDKQAVCAGLCILRLGRAAGLC